MRILLIVLILILRVASQESPSKPPCIAPGETIYSMGGDVKPAQPQPDKKAKNPAEIQPFPGFTPGASICRPFGAGLNMSGEIGVGLRCGCRGRNRRLRRGVVYLGAAVEKNLDGPVAGLSDMGSFDCSTSGSRADARIDDSQD